jgi:hypothetical protein
MWLLPVAWHWRVVLKSTSVVVPNRLVTVLDRHQRRLAFALVRNDAVAQALHHALHILLQPQLAPMGAIEIHFPLDIFIYLPEHLREQLVAGLKAQHSPPLVRGGVRAHPG